MLISYILRVSYQNARISGATMLSSQDIHGIIYWRKSQAFFQLEDSTRSCRGVVSMSPRNDGSKMASTIRIRFSKFILIELLSGCFSKIQLGFSILAICSLSSCLLLCRCHSSQFSPFPASTTGNWGIERSTHRRGDWSPHFRKSRYLELISIENDKLSFAIANQYWLHSSLKIRPQLFVAAFSYFQHAGLQTHPRLLHAEDLGKAWEPANKFSSQTNINPSVRIKSILLINMNAQKTPMDAAGALFVVGTNICFNSINH